MKWPCPTVAALCVVVGLASPSAAGQVKLTIRDGLVTLEAKDATIREIFAEWARVGQTRVVNAESAPGGPMTVQLTDVPERQALDTLLRSASGFLAVPRAVSQASASMYDRIVLMPGTRPAVVATAASRAPSGRQPAPSVSRGRNMPEPVLVADGEDEQDPDIQISMPGGAAGAARPGMATPPFPFNGADTAFPTGRRGQRGTPGDPDETPDTPNQQVNPDGSPTGASARPGQAVPQAAPRPGMMTSPVGPIKK